MRARFGQSLVDQLVKAAAVHHLDKRSRGIGSVGRNPDGGRVLNADPLSERIVGLDLCGQLALRVNGEGKRNAVALCKTLSELGKLRERLDGALAGECCVAIVVAELLAPGIEPACVDCGLETPGMKGQREIVAHP